MIILFFRETILIMKEFDLHKRSHIQNENLNLLKNIFEIKDTKFYAVYLQLHRIVEKYVFFVVRR